MGRYIAFNGFARGGKTTSARIMQVLLVNPNMDSKGLGMIIDDWDTLGWYYSDLCSFDVVSFADPLRSIAEILTGISADSWRTPEIKESKLRSPYDDFTGREFLETLGTEVLRDNLHTDCHVNACQMQHEGDLIYDDLRMENEAEYIKNNNGVIIQVTGRGYVRDHRSGGLLDNKFIDYKVDNSKTLSYLVDNLKEVLQNIDYA